MGRSESKQAAQQASAQSAQDQSNAQSALASTNKSLQDYSGNLNQFMKFGRSTYGQNGEFARDQSAIATQAAGAGSNAVKGDLALNAMRTGENTAGYAPAIAADRRQRQQDLTGQLAGADATRLEKLTNLNQFGVQASALPAQVQAGLYGTGTSGSTGQGANQASAAKTPGFFDTFLPALVGAAGTAAAGFCPCEGSLIKLADSTSKPVEQLKQGDWLWSTTVSPPNMVLCDPVPYEQDSWEIETNEGQIHRGSDTHTIALATGGYAYMPDALGKTVIGEYSGVVVKSAKYIGKQKVYPVQINGSHCYVADGILVFA